jgi:acetoin utilization protein AcuB
MLVKNWMTRSVISADVEDSIGTAVMLLNLHNIRMLPVREESNLVGIMVTSDIQKATGTYHLQQGVYKSLVSIKRKKVRELMTDRVITVPYDYTVEETAEILIENSISGVPVVDHKEQMVGIITRTDLLKAVIAVTGAIRKGIQYGFEVEDCPGSIKKLTDIIRSHGGRITSILTSFEGAPYGYRKAYIRMCGIDRFRLRSLNEALKENATLNYVIDRPEVGREIYIEQMREALQPG